MVCASVQLIWQLHAISQVNLRRKGIKGADLKPSAEETAALSFQSSSEDIPARLSHSVGAPRLADAHLFRLMTRIKTQELILSASAHLPMGSGKQVFQP